MFMRGLEPFLLLILLAIVILIIVPYMAIRAYIMISRTDRNQEKDLSDNNLLRKQVDKVLGEVKSLQNDLQTLRQNIGDLKSLVNPPPPPQPTASEDEHPVPAPAVPVEPPVIAAVTPPPPTVTLIPAKESDLLQHPVFNELQDLLGDTPATPPQPAVSPVAAASPLTQPPRPNVVQVTAPPAAPAYQTPPPHQPGAFESAAREALTRIWSWIVVGEEFRRPGIAAEYAIATAWLVRGAAAIILAGMIFLLKYSIDHGMLPPLARVTLTLAGGLVLLLPGLKLASGKYRQLAIALIGMGIATFYFAVYAAGMMYHLLDPLAAFALMALVTVSAGFLSVRTNALLLAVIGVFGGYLTPVLLSTGVKNLPGLYAYMLLIGAGTLYIAIYRNWRLIHYLSFLFTWGIFFLALDKFYLPKSADFIPVFSFLTAFFVLFSIQPIVYQLRTRTAITWLELVILLINVGIFFGEGCKLVVGMNFPPDGLRWTAAISIGMTLYYIAQLGLFNHLRLKDSNLYHLLLALAVFSFTVTFPLLLSGEAITAAWAVQAPLLLWLSIRTSSRLVRLGSYLVYMLVLFRIVMFDLGHSCLVAQTAYLSGALARLTTIGMFTLSLAAGYWILRRNSASVQTDLCKDDDQLEKKTLFWTGFIVLFLLLHFEFYYLSNAFYAPMLPPLLTAVWLGAVVFCAWQYRQTGKPALAALLLIFIVGLFLKIFIFDLYFWRIDPTDQWLYSDRYSLLSSLSMRALSFLPAVLLAALLWPRLQGNNDEIIKTRTVLGGGALLLLFTYLTLELNFLLFRYQPDFRAGGISVLWGVFALGLIIGGIIRNGKPLRYAGLTLFSITVIKIFFVDLSHLGAGAKIIAFILLGLVLLAAAGIYIKFGDRFQTATTENKKS